MPAGDDPRGGGGGGGAAGCVYTAALAAGDAAPSSWVAARLVREFWPDEVDPSASHPEVQVHPDWQIYMSPKHPGAATISRADLVQLPQGDRDAEQYAIPSDDGLIFFIVGPPNAASIADGGVANARVRWGPVENQFIGFHRESAREH